MRWVAAWAGSAAAMTIAFAPILRAQDGKPSEADVKALYLYNFLSLVKWPGQGAAANDRFIIGVWGANELEPKLKHIATNGKIDGKPVVWHHFKSAEDYQPCHLLFIAAEPADANSKETPADRLGEALKKIDGKPVLIVTETDGLLAQGAMLNFYRHQQNIRFEANDTAARKAGLTLGSKILQLGERRKE